MKFLIDFKNDATQEQIDQYFSTAGVTVVATYSAFDKTYRVEAASAPAVTDIVEFVVDDEAAPIQLQTVRTVEFATADDANWWKVASMQSVNFELPTQQMNRLGAHATVYIMDSGVDAAHSEFVNADIQNLYSFTGDFADTNGHGTAIASLISGEACGVTDAKIRAVKIFQSGTPTLQSHLLSAFDAIIGNMIPGEVNIVNMSWSIPKNPFIESKIRALINAGAYAVASAGNSGVSIEDVTPAAMPEVITVGAYNQDLEPCNFSNYTGVLSTTQSGVNTGELDCWAPGENLRVAQGSGFAQVAGTSFACAVQAAAIAFSTSKLVLTDNTVPAHLSELAFLGHSSNLKSFLTLSEKYATSTNRITAFNILNASQPNGKPKFDVINFIGESNTQFQRLIADISQYSNVAFADALPQNVNLSLNNGWIIGSIQTNVPLYWTSKLIFTTLTGEIFEIPVKLAIYPLGGSVSDFDPELNIKLNPIGGCEPVAFGTSPNIFYVCQNTIPSACNFGAESCYDCSGTGGNAKTPDELICNCTVQGEYITC